MLWINHEHRLKQAEAFGNSAQIQVLRPVVPEINSSAVRASPIPKATGKKAAKGSEKSHSP